MVNLSHFYMFFSPRLRQWCAIIDGEHDMNLLKVFGTEDLLEQRRAHGLRTFRLWAAERQKRPLAHMQRRHLRDAFATEVVVAVHHLDAQCVCVCVCERVCVFGR